MAKKSDSVPAHTQVQTILITQPRPVSEKSPYFELERKFGVVLEFEPLIEIKPIEGKDFRKQKVNVTHYNGVIFTSRHAIDHFFRIAEENKITISQDTKYFCITEAIALYLQKFILYRKRKVFYGADGSNKSLFDVINKHKDNIKFLYVCSESGHDSEITAWLRTHDCEYVLGCMYRTESSNIKNKLANKKFDVVCFFTPTGIKSWIDNFPGYKQNGTVIGTFGDNTKNAAISAKLKPQIVAPQPKSPSMITALSNFLNESQKTSVNK